MKLYTIRMNLESPVETERKTLPRGDGQWPGFARVYQTISGACDRMGQSASRLNEEHVRAMAILGCGHEETMKYEQMRLRSRGWA